MEDIGKFDPEKNFEKQVNQDIQAINKTLDQTKARVRQYINQIKALPDDFKSKHFEKLKESIHETTNKLSADIELLKHDFKKLSSFKEIKKMSTIRLNFDQTFEKLDEAIDFLLKKHDIYKLENKQLNLKISNEMIAVYDIVLELIAEMEEIENLVPPAPIKPVDLRDEETYRTGLKVAKSSNEKKFGKHPGER